MEFPLSLLVTRQSAPSQLWFAREAADALTHGSPVRAEPNERGLILRGMTEVDLEIAYSFLESKFPGLRINNFTVEYEVEKRLEPYYLATVDTPDDFMGNVVGDLSSRRGMIVGMKDCHIGKRIEAEVPVGECIGYASVLSGLTKGRGH